MNDTSCLNPDERQDFVDWYLKNIAYRARSKDGSQPLRSKHLARFGSSFLRGSDQTERIFVAITALVESGCSEKEACIVVAESPYVKLGQSGRGRPSGCANGPGVQGRSDTVRALFNRHKKRDTSGLVTSQVSMFKWLREQGIVVGSDFVKESGLAMQNAWRRHLQQITRR